MAFNDLEERIHRATGFSQLISYSGEGVGLINSGVISGYSNSGYIIKNDWNREFNHKYYELTHTGRLVNPFN